MRSVVDVSKDSGDFFLHPLGCVTSVGTCRFQMLVFSDPSAVTPVNGKVQVVRMHVVVCHMHCNLAAHTGCRLAELTNADSNSKWRDFEGTHGTVRQMWHGLSWACWEDRPC